MSYDCKRCVEYPCSVVEREYCEKHNGFYYKDEYDARMEREAEEEERKRKEEREEGGCCYLTTVMCEILNKPDNCYELDSMRSFRKNYLKGREEGEAILREYDEISPSIVKKLLSNQNKKAIAETMLSKYINPVLDFIKNNEPQKAIALYKEMVHYVKDV